MPTSLWEREFRDGARLAQIGFATSNEEGDFEYTDEIYARMLGREHGELVGVHWRATVHSDDHGRTEEGYRLAVRDGHSYVEIRGLRPDGTVVYQALNLSRRGPVDSPQGFHCIRQDISRYKNDQEVLGLAVESAPNGLLILNSAGQITMVNAAVEKLFGYARNELIDQPVEHLLPERVRHRHREHREGFNRNNDSKAMAGRDLRGLRKDGVEIPLEVSLNTIDTPGGRLILATIIDIDERLRYQRQLETAKHVAESASRAKSDFLARMSHEIRTPMGLIMGMNALLLEGELNAKQREYAGISYRNVRRLLRLINGILDLAKVESGKFTLDAVPFDIREVMDECAATMASTVERKGLRLRISLHPQLWHYWVGDPERIEQILLNLIGNAVKFTDRGGILVSVIPRRRPDGEEGLQFSVVDTGCGISMDRRGAIFEAFEQAEVSLSRRYEGTGLGLSIAGALAKLMSGELWLSASDTDGTTFEFTIFAPRSTAEALALHAQGSRHSHSAQNIPRGSRVLIADDNPENVVLIESYLEELELVLDFARNGEEALQKRRMNAYDLILMDIQMPVMDGYAATEEIRKWEQANHRRAVPIVALTAHAIAGAEAESLRAGCTRYLSKPIERDELITTIANLLALETTALRAASGMAETKVTSNLPEAIVRLRPAFLANRRADILQLRESLQEGNFAAIRTIGHNCKGVGKNYGFPEITTVGAELEAAAIARDTNLTSSIIEKFASVVHTARE